MKKTSLIFLVVTLAVACFFLINPGTATWKTLERNKSVAGLEVPLTVLKNKRVSNVKTFGLGHRIRAKAMVDQLPETNRFWMAVNEHLKFCGAEQVTEFCPSTPLRTLWSAFRYRDIPVDYHLTSEWQVQLATPDVVSVLNEIADYTGGAHGGMEIQTWNAIRTHSGWRELTLKELFKTNSNWQPELAKRVTTSLNRDRRERYFGDQETTEELEILEISAEELDNQMFTLCPEGIQFWYAPYEVGSWAEGTYNPMVSYLELESLLDEHGPAKGLRGSP